MKYKLFILSLLLLTLNACGGSGDNSANGVKNNKAATELPVELQKLALSVDGTLNAYITIDGDTANRKIMTIDRVNGTTATVAIDNLSLNVHDISITYEYTINNGKTYILADASKTVDLSSGVANLSFTSNDYVFDTFDDDGDTVGNAQELRAGTDPGIINPHFFTSAIDISMDENAIFTGYTAEVTSIDNDSVVFSLSTVAGQDQALFNINSNTGQLMFKIAADFEAPTDVNQDNIYEISIVANDGVNTVVQNIRITVNDLLIEGPDPDSSLRLYLSANDGVTGQELFVTDGTAGGTVLLKDINTSGNSNPDDFIVIKGILYFKADDGFSGVELWRSNGTTEGTVMVKDINEGVDSGISSFVVPGSFSPVTVDEANPLITIGDTFYFIGDDGINGIGLWKSDGTTEGTFEISINFGGLSTVNLWPLIHGSLTAVGKNLYFLAPVALNTIDLYKFDETIASTVFVGNINLDFSLDHSPYRMVSVGDMLYFSSDAPGGNGIQLWKNDNTADIINTNIRGISGSVFIKDIKTGIALEDVLSKAVAVENLLYFVEGTELWKSDGAAAGTVLVSSKLSAISELTAVGNTLYFNANDGINGAELWKSDGTDEGTVLVKDINAGNTSGSPTLLTALGNDLFFAANNGASGVELWKSDGTEEGTILVKDINTGFNSSFPSLFTVVKNELYFRANDGITGAELWKSDGTEEGTVLVKDILTGISGSQITIIGGSNLN